MSGTSNVPSIIDSVTRSAESISSLGQDGLVLGIMVFSFIFVLLFVFILLFLLHSTNKTRERDHMSNLKHIVNLETRLSKVETMFFECIESLSDCRKKGNRSDKKI